MSKFAWGEGTTGVVLGGAAALVVVVIGLSAANRLVAPKFAPEAPVSAVPEPPANDDTAAVAAPETAEPPQEATAPETPEIVETTGGADAPDEGDDAAGIIETFATDGVDMAAETPLGDGTAAISDAALDRHATESAERPAPGLGLSAPKFDLVRVEQDGTTLVAGAAMADSAVDILLDGAVQDSVVADDAGQFVSFLSLPPSNAARVLTLRMTAEAGVVTSADEVILAPAVAALDPMPEPPPVAPAAPSATSTISAAPELARPAEPAAPAAAPDPAQISTASAVPDAVTAAPEAQEGLATGTAPAAVAPPEPVTATAPAVILSRASGLEILQAPQSGTARPDAATNSVALDAITYEDDGAVILTGRGGGADQVRVYLDNKPVTTSRIGVDGRWRATLPDVDTGTYTLRVDELAADGSVASRVESPFLREAPGVLAAAAARGPDAAVQAVTVQPGHTLWAIARDRYGEGIAYVRVFEANRDSIRDPDLIYPGQVFSIPGE